MTFALGIVYLGRPLPTSPMSDSTPAQHVRNAEIMARYVQGERVIDLARRFGISPQRVHQIVRGRRW